MITITKKNFQEYFSEFDIFNMMNMLKKASQKNNIEKLNPNSIYIEIIEISIENDLRIYVELFSFLNEDCSDIIKAIKNVFISENQEDMDELLDKINEYNKIDGEN